MDKVIKHIIEFFKPDSYPVGLKQFNFEKNSKPIKYDWKFDSSLQNTQAYKSIQSFYK